MRFLVDANVLSEPTKPKVDTLVVSWLRTHEKAIVVDPVIMGKVLYGILRLPRGKRRQRLEKWFEGGIARVTCLPWDAATGRCWARLLVHLQTAGKTMSVKDSMIAATALHHRLILVTRNERHFVNSGVKLLDPFTKEVTPSAPTR